MKDAPPILGKLAGQCWALALEHARDAVLAEFSGARGDLALKQDELLVRSRALVGEMSAVLARSEPAVAANAWSAPGPANCSDRSISFSCRLRNWPSNEPPLFRGLSKWMPHAKRSTTGSRTPRSRRDLSARAWLTTSDLSKTAHWVILIALDLTSALKRHGSIEAEMRGSLEKARSAIAAAV